MPTPSPLPPDHPAFGPCITVRRKGVVDWIIWGFLISLLLLLGLLLVGTGVSALIHRDPDGWILTPIGLVLLALLYPCIRALARVVEFYHAGIVDRSFSKRREFPYEGATELTYSLIRQYNGIYTGTTLGLTMKTADARTLKYRGTHKERPKGLSVTILSRNFKGEDELDVVRDIIASHVAQSLLASLAPDKPIPWAGRADISAGGVIPSSGPRKKSLVPWSEINNIGFGRGSFGLFLAGNKKAFVEFAINAKNFYPGLEIVRTFLTQSHTDARTIEPVGEQVET